MADEPHIVIRFNMAVLKDVRLAKDELTIGRKAENDIPLDNQAVSGVHCKIKKENGDFFLVDMNSTNGTFVNGRKITKEKLKHKDSIRVARYTLEFLWEAKAFEEMAKNASHIIKQEVQEPASQPKVESVATAQADKKDEIPHQVGATIKGDRPLPAPSGIIKVISGGEGQTEVRLTELITYIGTGSQAAIKIKGFMAPELAAAISRRPDGYFLKAVKTGYPKVNGINVNDQIFLESGALIEVGGTNMVFYVDDPSKKGAGK